MYKKFISAFKLFDILVQAIYSLALPIGICALASYLLTTHAACPPWIWAVLLTVGSLVGLFSMIRYVVGALDAQTKMEKANAAEEEKRLEKEKLHERLREEAKEVLKNKNDPHGANDNVEDKKEGEVKS